jgi:hypothetical protein
MHGGRGGATEGNRNAVKHGEFAAEALCVRTTGAKSETRKSCCAALARQERPCRNRLGGEGLVECAERLLRRDAHQCRCRAQPDIPNIIVRNAEALRFALPAFICFAIVVVATQAIVGLALTNWSCFNFLIVLSSFLAVLALRQGTVILTGGLDLSVLWTIGFTGILLAGMVRDQTRRGSTLSQLRC